MTTRRLLVVGAILIAVGGAFWAATRAARGGAAAMPEAPAGDPVTLRFFKDPAAVPDFTATTLDGRTISSSDWKGKVTLVNFWATWCPPCRAEIPDLIALQAKYPDHLQIIGISEDQGSVDAVKAFVAEHGITYPVIMATPEIEQIFAGVNALPTSFMLDREGRIVQKHLGLYAVEMFEHETRALAGLPTTATIEHVAPDAPVGLENAAQAKEIPGVDLAKLTPDQRGEALQRLNSDSCTCGCGLTLARCRVDDPSCGVSLPIARKVVDEIAARQ